LFPVRSPIKHGSQRKKLGAIAPEVLKQEMKDFTIGSSEVNFEVVSEGLFFFILIPFFDHFVVVPAN
jgi:hypothetical protein